jgi:metal-dependent amidase/aminoacylase/carboxypeptidase family protein
MRVIASVLLLCSILSAPPLRAQAPAFMTERLGAYLTHHADAFVELRRDLHPHPELSGAEVRTAGVVAERLRALGLEVRTGVGGHGVVGILTGGKPGPLVAYRADMDAVRSTAPDPVAYASTVPGVRHICGHDLHVTIGLALAGALAHLRADVPGRVMFIFQPAEERATGAQAMLDDGLFAKEKPVAIYGLHTAPHQVGRLSLKPDVMMLPNPGGAPGAINDPALTAAAKAALISALGAWAVIDLQAPPERFSEDFGWFQKQVPGVFFFLGASNEAAGIEALPHSPGFRIDEEAIRVGVRAMAAVVLDRLGRPARRP